MFGLPDPYEKFTRNVESCPACRLCFEYMLMLEDECGVVRVIGDPFDKCNKCSNCDECCKCEKVGAAWWKAALEGVNTPNPSHGVLA